MARKKAAAPEAELELVDEVSAYVNSAVRGGVSLTGDSDTLSKVHYWIPTGCAVLDATLGGGFPSGRSIEISGKELAGKSTLLMHSMLECQALGGLSVLIDSEASMFWDRKFVAERFNPKRHLNLEVETVEEGFDAIESVLDKMILKNMNIPILIGWDTIAASEDEKLAEGKLAGKFTGKAGHYKARVIQNGFKKITRKLAKTNAALVILNQVISNISLGGFGPTETTPGGRALRHYPSIRMWMKKTDVYKGPGDAVIGSESEIRVIKNKVRRAISSKLSIPIRYDEGIDNIRMQFLLVATYGAGAISEPSTKWYRFEQGPLAETQKKFRATQIHALIEETPELGEWLQQEALDVARNLL